MQNYKVVLTAMTGFSLKNSTVIHLEMKENTPSYALDLIKQCGITSADLRTKTLFVPDPSNPLGSVLLYSALTGFAGRYLDYVQESEVVEASATHRFLKKVANQVELELESQQWLQVGSPYPGITAIPYGFELGDKEIADIKNSKKVRLALAGLDSSEALNLLITLCGIRSKEKTERMPYVILDPSLPWEEDDVTEIGKKNVNGFDLEDLRKQGGELRRNSRIDKRDALVQPEPVRDEYIFLQQASEYPVEKVLIKLKTKQNPETELWHCPRPNRHKNKDANASTKVMDGKVRCFRCDAEPVDSLRLVMDCLQLDPHQAAEFILNK